MWAIETWIPPVREHPERDQYGVIVKLGKIKEPGFWHPQGAVETAEEAEAVLREWAKQYVVARAKSDATEGIVGMRVDRRSFAKWTGSGGSF